MPSYSNLQDLIDAQPDLVDYFYNDTLAPHSKDRAGLSPVPAEFTNWRDEQRAWREAICLFDQSHHMPETFLSGPDAKALLNHIGINSFANFGPLKAKQFVGVNHQGHVIGECVLEWLPDDTFELVSGMHLQNWIQYNAEVGGYDVTLVRDMHTSSNPGGPDGRTKFRFGMDGPHAEALFREVIETDVGEIKFFNLVEARIAGCDVLALRHGMAGHKGVEISGAYADGPKVRAALMAAGEKYGIRAGGTKAYFSTLGESGWIGYPTPALYTDPGLADYRKWLPADGWEASTQFGGSYRPKHIEDYYVTPWDLNLDKHIKFDHDFIGREALEKMTGEQPRRRKVTLVWSAADIAKIQGSMLSTELPFKYLEMPFSFYAFQMADEVKGRDERTVGYSTYIGYTVNEGKFLSIAFIDADHAEVGTEVVLTWGEPDGGSRKPQVERHRQTTVRCTVGPNPYAGAAQIMKNAHLSGSS